MLICHRSNKWRKNHNLVYGSVKVTGIKVFQFLLFLPWNSYKPPFIFTLEFLRNSYKTAHFEFASFICWWVVPVTNGQRDRHLFYYYTCMVTISQAITLVISFIWIWEEWRGGLCVWVPMMVLSSPALIYHVLLDLVLNAGSQVTES